MAFTSKDDINILQPSDSAVVGAGSGNDVYVLALDRLSAGQQVQISDTQGNNSLQLIGGLTISSSIVAANAAQLTLSNGAIVTVLGADNFSYEIGGNPLTKTAGVVQNYATFATSTLGASSVPGSGTVQGAKNVTVSSTGTGSTLTLELMDTHSNAAGTGPLKDNPYNGFQFYVNGKLVKVASTAIDNALTYAELKTAITDAVKAVPELANFTVDFGRSFTVSDTLGSPQTGTTITLTSTKGEVVTTSAGSGWVASGAVPASSGLYTNMYTAASTSTNFHTSVSSVDNNIQTGAGNDLIYLGAGGHDTIDGGAGTDSVSLTLTKSQATYTSEGNGLIRLVGTTFAADLYNVEKLVFTDQTVTLA